MNKKTSMKIVIIIIVLLLVILLGYYFFKILIRGNIMDGGNMTKYSDDLLRLTSIPETYDELLKVTYSCSGNSNGNVYRVTLDVEKNMLIKEEKEMHSDPLKITEYSVNPEYIDEIIDDIEEYNFPEWKNEKKDYEKIALDGPSSHLTFEYDNSEIGGNKLEFYGVDFDLKLADDCNNLLYELAQKIQMLAQEENKIRQYIEESE